ncbi:MAG: DNA primase, partial [Propionibacteriaceae bacterium]|nr:DNA primase [Propionibacteriaceae bacterium]
MAFPPRFLDELKDRVGLAEVIGRRVRLVRKGHEHQGLCPFHNEKTPSFTVNEDKGFYHCFGCGAHGSVFDFVMNTENMSFPEAVERLAAEAGMEVPRDSPEEQARAQVRKDLYDVVEAAAAWFEGKLRLPEGKAGL